MMATARSIGLEAGLYLALTLALTWPLGRDLGGSIAGDYGDPLLVCWILAWVMRSLTGMVTGDATAIAGFWHAPIFFPERHTLAMSEHFTAQAIQALPIWWTTGNLLLAYNCLVVLSFVAMALATSALARELTGSRTAGIAAGIMAAFNPYRWLFEISHLQVLSLYWLPLALLALHRFVRSGSTAWLAVGGIAVVLLNWSSGYYLLYCAPVIALFTLAAIHLHGRWRDRTTWFGLVVAAVCVALLTAPFALAYLQMQRLHNFARPFDELVRYSLTLEQYRINASWLGVIAVCSAGVVFTWRRDDRLVRGYVIVLAALSILTFWLSLGPVVRVDATSAGVPGLYRLFYDWVPGFEGLRAASRYVAVLLVVLPVLAALGLTSLTRMAPRLGQTAAVLAAMIFLWASWPPQFLVNGALPARTAPPPAYLTPSPRLPAIYATVAGLDPDVVLVELPFGDPTYELRYMFFAALHERRLMNGYSGVFPASYMLRASRLTDPLAQPAAAAEALAGATHVVVHRRAWADDTGQRIETWLESIGAVLVTEDDDAVLLALQPLRREAHAHAPQ